MTDSTNRVRWGLLSTARINEALIPAIRMSARGELAAVASRGRDSAESYARHWRIPHAFAGYDAMLASDAVDAVYIGLPNHLHAEWTIKALRAGKHVLCEKPFALSLAEVDAVRAAAAETGGHVMEAFMYRHHPQTRAIADWVRSGRLGDIAYVWGVFNFHLSDPANVRLRPEWGGGALWDVGVYPLSLAQLVYGGPPEAVTALQRTGPTGIDVFFTGQMHYPGGGVAHLVSSFSTPYHTAAVIMGSAGRLEVARPFHQMDDVPRGLVFHPADQSAPQVVPVPRTELYLGQVDNMHAAILDGAPLHVTLDETADHIRTALALYRSAESGGQLVRLAAVS